MPRFECIGRATLVVTSTALAIEDEDPTPFEAVHITPVLDDSGVAWQIVGIRQGCERSVRVQYKRFLEQAEDHLVHHHGKSGNARVSDGDWDHALMRAAVAFLVD